MDRDRDTAYDASTSAGFAEIDSRLGWVLGYPFVLRALGVGGPHTPRTLLDYGCGPGKVAERIARRYGISVVAMDPSTEMLAIAAQRYSHPRVTYHLLPEKGPTFLADESVDAAMACFVLVVLPSREQLRAIAAEVWRVLRPGGRFVVLNPNPDQVGVQFSSSRSGEPGVTYQDGDPLSVRLLLTNGEWLELQDYFWSTRTYEQTLTEAGFTDLRTETPLLADAHGVADPVDLDMGAYEIERRHAPCLLLHGDKPAT